MIKLPPTTLHAAAHALHLLAMSEMSASTGKAVVPPGMGKWNRKKRKLSKGIAPVKATKPISKSERREKYTAVARDLQIRSKSKNLICYHCRESGHSVLHCPKAGVAISTGKGSGETESNPSDRTRKAIFPTAICYKCGSTEHTLAACPKRRNTSAFASSDPNGVSDDDLPFATCFVCKEKGHLASGCPRNANGIFVNGGECKHCGSKQHRGMQCPEWKDRERVGKERGRVEEQDFSDLIDQEDKPLPSSGAAWKTKTSATGKRRRVVNF
jgi:zinc finger CCHC domain-containing protein 9